MWGLTCLICGDRYTDVDSFFCHVYDKHPDEWGNWDHERYKVTPGPRPGDHVAKVPVRPVPGTSEGVSSPVQGEIATD